MLGVGSPWRVSGFSPDLRPTPVSEMESVLRIYKGDKWTRIYGSRIPIGVVVEVVKFYRNRRVMVEYKGERILTMLWCLEKLPSPAGRGVMPMEQ